jgi:hypothetical protein
VLAHLRRRWSLSGREGLGLKRLFSTTSEVGKEMEVNGGHRGDRTRSLFDRTSPVSVQRLRVFQFDDRTWWRVRSLSTGRVRSFRELTGLQPDAGTVASGQFCSASGHCFVVRCSGLTSASGQSRDQRVRSVTGPARPVNPSASGLRDERVRSVLRDLAVVRPACPVSWTSASGQHDFGCFKFLTALFEGVRL